MCSWNHFLTSPPLKCIFLHGQRRCKLELIFPGTWCSIFLQFIFKCSFRWQGQLSGEREAATNVTNIRNQGKRRQIEIYTEYICRVRPTFGEREREKTLSCCFSFVLASHRRGCVARKLLFSPIHSPLRSSFPQYTQLLTADLPTFWLKYYSPFHKW